MKPPVFSGSIGSCRGWGDVASAFMLNAHLSCRGSASRHSSGSAHGRSRLCSSEQRAPCLLTQRSCHQRNPRPSQQRRAARAPRGTGEVDTGPCRCIYQSASWAFSGVQCSPLSRYARQTPGCTHPGASSLPAILCGYPQAQAQVLYDLRPSGRSRTCFNAWRAPPATSRGVCSPLAAHTCIGQRAVALVPGDIIDAGPLVQAGVGGTFVDVGLAVWACRNIGGGWVV